MSNAGLSFGGFSYDPVAGLLSRDGEAVPLGRRSLLLLEALLARRGTVVTKAELIDAAWPGELVEESNLSVQVSQLRKIIGAQWIRTVERVGYQFVPSLPPLAAAPERPTLAILPFTDLGTADGVDRVVADELKTALTRFGSLQVVSDPAGAGYRLEGSVRRHGGSLVIGTRIADSDGAFVWSDRLRAAVGDGRALDRAIARIASTAEAQIELTEIAAVSRRHEPSPTAATLYRRAQAHLRTSRPEDYAVATSLLEQALELEPDNVAFLAAICEALHHRIGMGWPAVTNNDPQRCLDYALRGLAQPVQDGNALALFGIAVFRAGDEDWGHSLMQRAAVLNPLSLQTRVYAGTSGMHWGDIAAAESHYRHGLALAPQSPAQGFVMGGLARIRMMQGRFEDALAWANRALVANPNYGATYWTLVAANAHLGHDDEAGRRLERFRRLQPGVTVNGIRTGQSTRSGRMASTLEGLEQAGLPRG